MGERVREERVLIELGVGESWGWERVGRESWERELGARMDENDQG